MASPGRRPAAREGRPRERSPRAPRAAQLRWGARRAARPTDIRTSSGTAGACRTATPARRVAAAALVVLLAAGAARVSLLRTPGDPGTSLVPARGLVRWPPGRREE